MSKALTSNAITGAVTVIVLSAGDIARVFKGKISTRQLLKNVAITTGGVTTGVGGTMGALGLYAWIVGTAATGGTALIVGGLGGVVGGMLGTKATESSLDSAGVKDDAEIMLEFFQIVLGELAESFMLSEAEAEVLMDKLAESDLAGHLSSLYSATNKRALATSLIKPIIVEIVSARIPVLMPSDDELLNMTSHLITQDIDELVLT